VVVSVRIGAGTAYWWAAATPLTNAGLREAGNVEFFLEQIGAPGERRVLFDEYFHGARPTLGASMLRSPVKWILAQAALVLAAVLLTWSRRSGPILLPATESRLSPLEFVRTLGSLYGRAGAAGVAVDVAYRRFRFHLGRRLGMSSTASIDSTTRAVALRWPIDAQTLATTLRQCEAARDDAGLSARTALSLVQALGGHARDLGLDGGPRLRPAAPRPQARQDKETR